MPLFACLVRDLSTSASVPADVLETIARACSPRVEPHGPDEIVFDASGLTRVIGAPPEVAKEVRRLAESHGVIVRIALAGTSTAAWLLAHAYPGVTIAADRVAETMAPLPIATLASLPDLPLDQGAAPRRRATTPRYHYRMAPGPTFAEDPQHSQRRRADPEPARTLAGVLATFERWGLSTLGDLARLPRGDLHARMGPLGVRLHEAACGEDAAPLVPADTAPVFEARLELEWPIEGLEPLAFVLARLCDALSAALERADRGAVAVTTTLHLVTRDVHVRTLHPPSPMRDARVLRTLITLDLESHPPAAAIDVVSVRADVAPGVIVQGSLLAHTLPTAEDLATLLARLGALMGESRIGAPARVDLFDERAVGQMPFRVRREDTRHRRERPSGPAAKPPPSEPVITGPRPPCLVLRRFRFPIPARVMVDRGRPVRVQPSARGVAGGAVVASAGPWRSSGRWWTLDRSDWDRDEWDVEIAGPLVYRIARARVSGAWTVEGEVD